ncbi:MAG: HEAT repeat domain-containing protein [Planctomycetales bacterium]|nr:HEAT repeat domain-containing protein [Planctomycetales bacterium]
MKKLLWPSLAGAIVLALIVFGYQYLGQSGPRSPEALEQDALHASSVDDRELAAAELSDWGEAAQDHMRRVLAQADSPSVRSLMIQGLGNVYDYESMDVFLAALDDESELVRGRAAAAVRKMLGRALAFDPSAEPAEREKAAELMRKEWKGLKGTPLLEDFKARVKNHTGGM